MADIKQGRWTAEIEGDFVVFIIGARVNSRWQLFRAIADLGGRRGMQHMLKYLSQHPEKGFLGYQTLGLANVQYWRSFEHLEAYARARDSKHYPAWTRFNKSVGSNGDVGIWHETYRVPAGSYETVYNNMPDYGLGKAAKLVPAAGYRETAAGRIGAVAHAQADAAVEASRGM